MEADIRLKQVVGWGVLGEGSGNDRAWLHYRVFGFGLQRLAFMPARPIDRTSVVLLEQLVCTCAEMLSEMNTRA